METENPMGKEFWAAYERGWSVIPVGEGGKQPLVSWRQYQGERASREVVAGWLERWPGANLGVVTGAVSGLVVLDVDGAGGQVALAGLGRVPAQPGGGNGKGGHH